VSYPGWYEPLKYFLPEWDDRVDPNYEFLSDTYSKSHSENPFENDAYIWDIFGVESVPVDGVLVSRSKLEENKTKLSRVIECAPGRKATTVKVNLMRND